MTELFLWRLIASHHDDVKGFISWRCGITFTSATTELSMSCPTCSLFVLTWATSYKVISTGSRVTLPGSTVCSVYECTQILLISLLLGCRAVPVSCHVWKTREWEWHSSKGCNQREWLWRWWCVGEPNMLRHIKRLGWPFRLRPLDAKTRAAGRLQQIW